MLQVNDINVYYGAIHAIKGVSFEVHQGEIVTLIGANGAGKSTILQTVSGLLRSRTGLGHLSGGKHRRRPGPQAGAARPCPCAGRAGGSSCR